MPSSIRRLLVVAAVLALFVGGGFWLRSSLGLELEIESVRALVDRMGPSGPLIFVGLIAGRIFLGLPSQVVLIAAGICFGTLVGSVVGGLGLMLSGMAAFFAARYAGREAVERRLGSRLGKLLEIGGHRAAGLALALGTGYPVAPLSPIQAAAGLTPMRLSLFMPAAFIGGSARAATFAYFGDALGDWSLTGIGLASLLFGAVVLTPLCFPSGREWVRRLLRTDFDEAASPQALPAAAPLPRAAPLSTAAPASAPALSPASPAPSPDDGIEAGKLAAATKRSPTS